MINNRLYKIANHNLKEGNYRLKSNLALITFMFLLVSFSNYAQEDNDLGTEVVNVVKPYTPTISDAFKVKETPSLNDSINTNKKDVKYSIFSVPVASTFIPAKGKATDLQKERAVKLYDNYATLGFGNYTSVLAEFYTNFQISRTDNFGLFLRHNSSQGGIDNIRLDDKYYDTRLDGNYTSIQRDMSFSLQAGIEHQVFNWYGFDGLFALTEDDFVNEQDVQQTYFSGYVGGDISLDDSFFEGGSATIRYLGDAYSSSEFNLKVAPKFSFPLTDFTLKIEGDIDYLMGTFKPNDYSVLDIKYSYLNLGINPSINYVNDDLTLSLGVGAYVSLDSENSETDFFLYPKINASYRLVDELLIAYGGVEGTLKQNSFYSFKEENPYIAPGVSIAPTSELYKGFVGLKGKLSNSVAYNVRASYGKEDNKALFRSIPPGGFPNTFEDFSYGNFFVTRYDDINTLSVFGELQVKVSDNFSFGLNGTFYSYNTDNELEAWNLPQYEASVFSDFSITEKFYGGVSIFFVGERKDLLIDAFEFFNTEASIVSLDSYIDANVHLGYKHNERLSFFVKGINLLGDDYQKWLNYPVLGIQAILGATYKFDW